MEDDTTPVLKAIAPGSAWERRHSPASFTFAAHTAFFAGFLPTPARVGGARAPRLFATRFPGSRSATLRTLVFDQADIVSGFAAAGYRTICIGGVGFFNKQSALGSVLPGYFQESHWSPDLGVGCLTSARNQVDLACATLDDGPGDQPVFLFMNISACHAPNHGYVPGETRDSARTQQAALADVDAQLPPLLARICRDRPTLAVICSDHGEAYGEDGHRGHRLGHETVWDVPYLETILPEQARA